jgi:large subunit ribosomal protein L23
MTAEEKSRSKSVAKAIKGAASRVRGRRKKDEPATGARPIEAVGTSVAARFNSERLMTLLLAPVVSEKATYIADKHQQVIFRVDPSATKPEVKAAVELMFSKKDKPVEVTSVQIVNVGGKKKRFGQFNGRRRDWKKAYVCLKAGQEINFAAEA